MELAGRWKAPKLGFVEEEVGVTGTAGTAMGETTGTVDGVAGKGTGDVTVGAE